MSDGELITDLAGLEALAPEWDALAVAASKPVAAPSWVLSWWRRVAEPDFEARVVAVRDHGTLVGVAPFYLSYSRRALRECRLMGSEFGVCMEPLALPGREWEVAAEIGRLIMASHPRPDVLAFGPMTLASHWVAALESSWPGRIRAPIRRLRVDGAPVIVLLEPSFDAWFASLSSKLRRSMRQAERLFEEAGGTTRWSTSETLAADAEAFARLHAARWENRGSRLIELGSRLPDWFEEVARGQIDEGRFRMCVLEIDGAPICVDFSLIAGRELAGVNSAWDESYAHLSPPKLAVSRVVQEACERGCRRVHLGLGNSPNKLRLANGNDPVAWTVLMRPSARLPLAYARVLPALLRNSARDAARRVLPRRWRDAARSTSRRLRREDMRTA